MGKTSWGRCGALLLLGLGASEVLIMISPFAGFFYASLRFEPFLGFLSVSSWTAWLDGFFLNHSVVTTSAILEWQRRIGFFLFTLGLWGFLISAGQVYGNKIFRRGVARGLLYRISRHPQYLCLGVAGWGLLTIWPRFLLLGLWVTMLFLYAALSRLEERRMEERFGDEYRRYAESRGAFLPGSPMRRLFEATFGHIRPRAVAWLAAYTSCLLVAFLLAVALRGYTRASSVIVERPADRMTVISAWPQSESWVGGIMDATLADEGVREHLPADGSDILVATILPHRYVMKGMYYKMPPGEDGSGAEGSAAGLLMRLGRIAAAFLVPIEGVTRPEHFMGLDPDESDGSVEVVISRARKPYKTSIGPGEVLDASVRLTPLMVVDLPPDGGKVEAVRLPLPQNRWGPRVVMPLF
jgi:protein-S-isoprenylcysteine O-methyltransferase Ste14